MSKRLMHRWFPTVAEEIEEQAEVNEAVRQDVERVAGFVRHPEFERMSQWIEQSVRENEPTPGDHANMLFQSGMVKGLRLVQDRMTAMLRQAQMRSEDGTGKIGP